MAGRPCERCSAKTQSNPICSRCIAGFVARLTEVPHLISQLHIHLAKQNRLAGLQEGGSSGGGGPKPLPLNANIVETLSVYESAVRRVARDLGMPRTPSRKDGSNGTVTCAEWLIGQVPRLAATGGTTVVWAIGELDRVADLAWSKIDRPPDTWYAGPCPGGQRIGDGNKMVPDPCGADLLAQPGATNVRCRRCRRTFPCSERRDALLAAMSDYRARAVWIASALTPVMGRRVTAQQIYVMVSRGKFVAHGTDKDRHPLYRIGDVVAELERLEARRAQAVSRVPRQSGRVPGQRRGTK